MAADRHSQRRDKLNRLVKEAGADALLVTNTSNVTYLTGFTGDSSYLLTDARQPVVLSDFRYITQLEDECPDLECHIRSQHNTLLDLIERTVSERKLMRLGIEAGSITLALADQIRDKLPHVELVRTSGLVEQLRIIKDRGEVDEIRLAARCAERAFGVVRAALEPGQTEHDVANLLEFELRRLGAAGPAFPPIIAVGPRAALPHASPGRQRIGDDPLLLVDWGARWRLYRSDLTRILVTGRIPPKLRKVYGVVLDAQRQAIEAIRPGVAASHVDHVARSAIDQAGFGKYFGHGLGHGIGLDIHEAPRLAAASKEVLKPGMVITIEPGIYLPGWGGVRIEDDVLVTKDGHQVLTSLPKELDEAVAPCAPAGA